MGHRRVEAPGEHEADSRLVEAALDAAGVELDVDPQLFEEVCRAAAAGRGAVPVLGDGDASARDDERRDRRDVERARTIAARPAGVDHRLGRTDGDGERQHRCRERLHLLDRLALGAKPEQERADLRLGGVALHHRGHRRGRVVGVERATVRQLGEDVGPEILVGHRPDRLPPAPRARPSPR